VNIVKSAVKNRDRVRVGLHHLKARIQLRGLHAIDKRCGAAKHLISWKAELVAALGGSENISPMKMTVIEEATRTAAYFNHIDEFLLSLESVIDRRAKKLRPIVESRMRIGEHLMRQLDRLGLEREPKPISALEHHFESDRDRLARALIGRFVDAAAKPAATESA
jgi:hypothetical protein